MSNFYITTSIPYVNGPPHLGHALEFIMADVLARYAKLAGHHVIFSTGCDEHGGKIAEKAAESGLTPQEFTDRMSSEFVKLAQILEISNNRFIRTTDKSHEDRVKIIWLRLKEDIYKSSYLGWYCTGDEAFFTETEVEANNGICPNHNRPYQKIEEENYFFKLSKYNSQIKAAIEKNEFKIYPETKRNEVLSLLEQGLEDISISRPKNNISWGISVPGDDSQVIYVWFEALMNYITVLGYPEHSDFQHFWPANVQIIGKDIIRFHAAIWPAMLTGLGLPLPELLYVHGFINVDGRKMSKSLNNNISPFDIIDQYGSEAFRYYLLRHIPSYNDGDFSWHTFEASYNNELANELGNAVQRTASMIERYLDGIIGEIPSPEHDIAQYEQAMKSCRFDKALDEIWLQIKGINQYIEEEKPWQVAKEDREHLKEILTYIVGGLIQVAQLLSPFMPQTAHLINKTFSSDIISPIPGTLFPKAETSSQDNER